MSDLHGGAGRGDGDRDRGGCRNTHIGAGALGGISHALGSNRHGRGRGYGGRCGVEAGRGDRADSGVTTNDSVHEPGSTIVSVAIRRGELLRMSDLHGGAGRGDGDANCRRRACASQQNLGRSCLGNHLQGSGIAGGHHRFEAYGHLHAAAWGQRDSLRRTAQCESPRTVQRNILNLHRALAAVRNGDCELVHCIDLLLTEGHGTGGNNQRSIATRSSCAPAKSE